MEVTSYEKDVILSICQEKLHRSSLISALNHPRWVKRTFKDGSYYLEVNHKELPIDRVFCCSSDIIGYYNDIEVHFIVQIENNTIWLECFSFGRNIPRQITYGLVDIKKSNKTMYDVLT